VDLVFTSPPYENARNYGMSFNLHDDAWVYWSGIRYMECLRVCRGLVAWVVQGRTRNYRWSATPALLLVYLHGAGVNLRNPLVYHRYGIPGSGGPDWLRSDYEWIICATQKGRLPWSDNAAMGHACKYGPGGAMSYRMTDGERANVARMRHMTASGVSQIEAARRVGVPMYHTTSGTDDTGFTNTNTYIPPEKANPGNIIT
jgi:hypothetical protein